MSRARVASPLKSESRGKSGSTTCAHATSVHGASRDMRNRRTPSCSNARALSRSASTSDVQVLLQANRIGTRSARPSARSSRRLTGSRGPAQTVASGTAPPMASMSLTFRPVEEVDDEEDRALLDELLDRHRLPGAGPDGDVGDVVAGLQHAYGR